MCIQKKGFDETGKKGYALNRLERRKIGRYERNGIILFPSSYGGCKNGKGCICHNGHPD